MCAAPQRHVVWIKTHKTGSSTITNVFHRSIRDTGTRCPTLQLHWHWQPLHLVMREAQAGTAPATACYDLALGRALWGTM